MVGVSQTAGSSGYVWIEPEPLPVDAPRLADDPLVNILLQGVVASRDEADRFVAGGPSTADPLLLPGMEDAVRRVAAAIRDGERIVVFGDYDADGVTSTAILVLALEAASGARPEWRLPSRDEGYGLSEAAAREIAAGGPGLLILADCGSRDHEAVAAARAGGLDVVIFDHHQMPNGGPDGALVASPRARPGAPYGELSAAGVVYFFARALAEAGFNLDLGHAREPIALLDLAAIGLVGDASPMLGEARVLVRRGLRAIGHFGRPGVRALCREAKLDPASVRSHDVGMRLAPRVNAPGRMAKPDLALELLLAPDPLTAGRLAAEVERHNTERRRVTDVLVASTAAEFDQQLLDGDRRCLVAVGEEWAHGIVGLVAGKLAQKYDRPVLLFAVDGDEVVGSARSVAGFDITAALETCRHLLVRFGGHSQAAGMRLARPNVPALSALLEEAVLASQVAAPQPNAIRIRADLPLDRMTLSTIAAVQSLEPFGSGFPEPILRLRGVRPRYVDRMGADLSHLKIKFDAPGGLAEIVLWGEGERAEEVKRAGAIDVVGRIGVNEWNGRKTPQMIAEDFRVARP